MHEEVACNGCSVWWLQEEVACGGCMKRWRVVDA